MGGTFEISCTAQYQGVKTTSVMAVASAVISVDQSILYGDLNSDGVITSADAVLLLWHVFLPDEYPLY